MNSAEFPRVTVCWATWFRRCRKGHSKAGRIVHDSRSDLGGDVGSNREVVAGPDVGKIDKFVPPVSTAAYQQCGEKQEHKKD